MIFGGVGSGLYGMFFYILIAVFIAGLMVGRTPEYLGKKIEAREIKFAALGALFVPACARTDRGWRSPSHEAEPEGDLRPGRARLHRGALRLHLGVVQQRQRLRRLRGEQLPREAVGMAMLLGRYVPDRSPRLAIGGSLAQKKSRPLSAGTFRTDGPTFAVLLVGVIVLTAGLMILPALFLGPIVEALD